MNLSYRLGWMFFRTVYATYFRWRVFNPERVPLTGPVILASNHASFLDPPLVGAGLVKTTRGFKGGVWLARSPAEIKLSEAVQLLEGDIAPVECINNPGACTRSPMCATRDVWDEMKQAMYGVLEATTLDDLVKRQEIKERQPQGGSYEI